MSWRAYEGQRRTSSVSPHCPHCLKQGLWFTSWYQASRHMTSGHSPVSISHLAIGMLGLQVHTTGTLSTRLSPQRRMVVVVSLCFSFLCWELSLYL